VWIAILYNVLIQCGILMNLLSLIKMSPNGFYSRFRVGKHLYYMFSITNDLKPGDVYHYSFSNFL
jgi:hypothetical protein